MSEEKKKINRAARAGRKMQLMSESGRLYLAFLKYYEDTFKNIFVYSDELKNACWQLSSYLTEREKMVLRMRFGINMQNYHTLKEVGKQLGINPERVRQIEAKAFRKLCHPTHVAQLKIFKEIVDRPFI